MMEIERKNARTIDLLRAKDANIQKVYTMSIVTIELYMTPSIVPAVSRGQCSNEGHVERIVPAKVGSHPQCIAILIHILTLAVRSTAWPSRQNFKHPLVTDGEQQCTTNLM